MAEQLLGEGNLVEPHRIRGIYCILPYGDVPEWPTTCHVDAHPFQLGVVGYIDYVPPGGGRFTVWPGSHRKFYYDFYSQYKHEPTEQYQKNKEFLDRQPSVGTTVDREILSSSIIALDMRPDTIIPARFDQP